MKNLIAPIDLEADDIISIQFKPGGEAITQVERDGVVVWSSPDHYESIIVNDDGQIHIKGFAKVEHPRRWNDN